MPAFGYARVSSVEQDLSIQEAALHAAGCQVIRAEKKRGAARDGRSSRRYSIFCALAIR
jgi:DNA invertase Pin-like site-specific DNA recombinase